MINDYEFLSEGIKMKRSDLENMLRNYGRLLEFDIYDPRLCESPEDKQYGFPEDKFYLSKFVGKIRGEEITRGEIMSRGKRSDSFVLKLYVLTTRAGIFKGFKDYSAKIYEECKKEYCEK